MPRSCLSYTLYIRTCIFVTNHVCDFKAQGWSWEACDLVVVCKLPCPHPVCAFLIPDSCLGLVPAAGGLVSTWRGYTYFFPENSSNVVEQGCGATNVCNACLRQILFAFCIEQQHDPCCPNLHLTPHHVALQQACRLKQWVVLQT